MPDAGAIQEHAIGVVHEMLRRGEVDLRPQGAGIVAGNRHTARHGTLIGRGSLGDGNGAEEGQGRGEQHDGGVSDWMLGVSSQDGRKVKESALAFVLLALTLLRPARGRGRFINIGRHLMSQRVDVQTLVHPASAGRLLKSHARPFLAMDVKVFMRQPVGRPPHLEPPRSNLQPARVIPHSSKASDAIA